MTPPRRRSAAEQRLRLRGFDYRTAAIYFVTINTRQHREVLGAILAGGMDLSAIGVVVKEGWESIPRLHPHVRLGLFVIMPNHLHALIQILDPEIPRPLLHGSLAGSLAMIIGGFKAAVTRHAGLAPGTLWQERFHDRIVRSGAELERIEEYIALNPERWPVDPMNPACPTSEPDRPWLPHLPRMR